MQNNDILMLPPGCWPSFADRKSAEAALKKWRLAEACPEYVKNASDVDEVYLPVVITEPATFRYLTFAIFVANTAHRAIEVPKTKHNGD